MINKILTNRIFKTPFILKFEISDYNEVFITTFKLQAKKLTTIY